MRQLCKQGETTTFPAEKKRWHHFDLAEKVMSQRDVETDGVGRFLPPPFSRHLWIAVGACTFIRDLPPVVALADTVLVVLVQHSQPCVVRPKHVGLHRLVHQFQVDRPECVRTGPDPVRQRRGRKVYAVAFEDFHLSSQRQAVLVLPDQQMRQQSGARTTKPSIHVSLRPWSMGGRQKQKSGLRCSLIAPPPEV